MSRLNLLVENCIIAGMTLSNNTSTGVFNNNVFGNGGLNFTGGYYTLSNNIFFGTTATFLNTASCIFYNNISTNTPIPAGNNNQLNVVLSTIFIGDPYNPGNYSFDSVYVLKQGSPAIGAGLGGTDCGAYGGANPYRPSGIPAIPSFYKISAPTNIASGNYTITFSVRSNN